MTLRFLYVMDPMCSWCYGFQPELEEFLKAHPKVQVDWIMGGLAPDNKQPMDEGLRQTIASYWYQIEERTQVQFNHEYWELNTPYRSTYIACRAVITAETLKENSAEAMVKSIQSAYYQQAKNPSLQETLTECAESIGLDKNQFQQALNSTETQQRFQQHLSLSQHLQVRGFPSLFFVDDEGLATPLTRGYCQAAELGELFKQLDVQR